MIQQWIWDGYPHDEYFFANDQMICGTRVDDDFAKFKAVRLHYGLADQKWMLN